MANIMDILRSVTETAHKDASRILTSQGRRDSLDLMGIAKGGREEYMSQHGMTHDVGSTRAALRVQNEMLSIQQAQNVSASKAWEIGKKSWEQKKEFAKMSTTLSADEKKHLDTMSSKYLNIYKEYDKHVSLQKKLGGVNAIAKSLGVDKSVGKITDAFSGKGGIIGGIEGFAKTGVDLTSKAFDNMVTVQAQMWTKIMGYWHTAWSGFAGGIQASFDMLGDFVGIFNSALGGMVKTMGAAIAKDFVFQFDQGIKRERMKISETGLVGGQTGMSYNMIGANTAITAEWAKAQLATGMGNFRTGTGETSQERFYALGRGMDMSAGEMGKFTEEMRTLTHEGGAALDNIARGFQTAKNLALQTGASTRVFTNAIMETAAQARMLNIDFGAVNNTVEMIAKKQRTLGAFGIDIKQDMGKISKELIGGAKAWDASTHAFIGQKMAQRMGMGGLDVPQSMMLSKYGRGVATGSYFDASGTLTGGGLTSGKMFGQQSSEQLSERLGGIKEAMNEAMAGATTDAEKVMRAQMMGQKFGLSDEASLALMATKDTDLKSLAETKEMKYEFMTAKQIANKTLLANERQEGWQGRMSKILGLILDLLMISFDDLFDSLKKFEIMDKKPFGFLPDLLKGEDAGGKWTRAEKDKAWNKAAKELGVEVKDIMGMGKRKGDSAGAAGVNELIDSAGRGVDAVTGAILRHGGGVIKLAPGERLDPMSGGRYNVTRAMDISRGDNSQASSGMYNFSITVNNMDSPQQVATKLKQAISGAFG